MTPQEEANQQLHLVRMQTKIDLLEKALITALGWIATSAVGVLSMNELHKIYEIIHPEVKP